MNFAPLPRGKKSTDTHEPLRTTCASFQFWKTVLDNGQGHATVREVFISNSDTGDRVDRVS